MNQQILDAKGRIDFWAYDIYPDTEITGLHINVSDINLPYYAHRTSPYKGNVKRCVVLQAPWVAAPNATTDAVWTSLTDWANWLLSEFEDIDYLRINNLPVVAFFGFGEWAGAAPGNANTLANYNLLRSLLGPIYAIGYGAINSTQATTLRLNAFTAYDGALGAGLVPNGQHPWGDQVIEDFSNWGHTGFDICATCSVWNNGTPRRGLGGIGWADQPTPQDQISEFQAFLSGKPRIIMVSPTTEIDEAGPLLRTIQDDMRWLEPIGWARGAFQKPVSYTYEVDCNTFYWTKVGTWSYVQNVAGCYNLDENRSSTAGDTATLTCNASILNVAANGTIELYAATGPDRGIIDILQNGVSVGTIDLYTPGFIPHVMIRSLTVNLGDTVAFRITGTKNGASSSVMCGIDSSRITYEP